MSNIEVIETVWIPLPDGTKLAARLWLPEGAKNAPVPCILEYIPYRRRDRTRMRDESMHPQFAAAGYASIRVDIRGYGDSDGVAEDEYSHQEIQDGHDLIQWIADQDWCDGNVGMFGKSWGAYNAFQVAATRPPALKAIAPVMGTDDRWREDIHFYGGCLANDNFWWGSIMQLYNAMPPDPQIVGADRWLDMWRERLEGAAFWPAMWLEHQTSRENLKMIADSLSRDVDEFFNRVPLRLLLHFKNVASILQTADDFYGTVQNLQDCIERNESDQEIRECYRHVEDYGTQFVRAFEPLRSSSGRVVLREIEDGMLALRNELNIAGTVDAVDVRSLIQTAARLEVLADHLEMDVTQWLNYERPSYATQAAQASDRFVKQAQRLHRSLQSRPTAAELKREVENLYVEFERIYGYLGRCRTEDRAHLKNIAYEIGAELNKIRTPLNL